jgi:hypothetical protein
MASKTESEDQFIDRIIEHLNRMLIKDPQWITRLVAATATPAIETQIEYGISHQSGIIGFLETLIGPTKGKGRIAVICREIEQAPAKPGEIRLQINNYGLKKIVGFKRYLQPENKKAPAEPPAPLITEADQHP